MSNPIKGPLWPDGHEDRMLASPPDMLSGEAKYHPQPVTGYRSLTQAEIDAMNEVKALADQVGALLERMSTDKSLDMRWLAIGKTHLQQGFMAVVRSIAQPTSF